MSAKFTYDGNRILPTPFPSISQSIDYYDNGEIRNVVYSITITGYIIANMGSPKTTGVYGDFMADDCETIANTDWTSAITEKWCIISGLFDTNYKELCVGSGGLLHDIKFYPRVVSKELDTSDENAQYAKYTIQMEADRMFCDDVEINPRTAGDCIKNYDESWDLSYDQTSVVDIINNNPAFEITRTISAQGIPEINTSGVITKTAYECAQEFICERLAFHTGVEVPDNCVSYILPSNPKKRNYSDVHSFNKFTGEYTVTESWFIADDYVETYTVNHSQSLQEACDTVAIQGSIKGYDCRDDNGDFVYSAFDAAKSGYEEIGDAGILTKVQNLVGFELDPYTESSTISYNQGAGTVDYDFTYKQRPPRYVDVAKSETVNVSNNWDEDVINKVLILGKGEVVKKNNVTGYRALSTTLNLDLVFPCSTTVVYGSGEEPDPTGVGSNVSIDDIPPYGPRFNPQIAGDIQSVVDVFNPTNVTFGGNPIFDNVAVESQNEDWNRNDGLYSYSVTWTYNYAGIC